MSPEFIKKHLLDTWILDGGLGPESITVINKTHSGWSSITLFEIDGKAYYRTDRRESSSETWRHYLKEVNWTEEMDKVPQGLTSAQQAEFIKKKYADKAAWSVDPIEKK